MTQPTVGFMGPAGTFTEEALLSQGDLSTMTRLAFDGPSEVLKATQAGAVEIGFVPIESSIEGTVNVTLDTLVFETELFIQREVVIGIHLYLLAQPGVRMSELERVVSYPHAIAQCRGFVAERLPGVEVVAANSTAEAARLVSGGGLGKAAAVAPRISGELYGLEVLSAEIEDHPDGQTRFVAVRPGIIAAPTGHDRTSIVCFQDADRPGNLHSILGQFSARGINLNKLESRPTKRALGDYCFVIDLEGHVADEVVGDCLRELWAELRSVKFLGSYPAAGEKSEEIRGEVQARWEQADNWLSALRERVESPGSMEGWQSGRMRGS